MESGLLFSTLVLAVGAFHLISKASAFLGKQMAKFRDPAKTKKVVRDDWYMFFNRSDLTGERRKPEAEKKSPMSTNRSNSTTDRRRRAVRMHSAL